MKIYTIGTKINEPGGHGESTPSTIAVTKLGPYRTGEYPPLLILKEKAELYLESLDCYFCSIIELELKV